MRCKQDIQTYRWHGLSYGGENEPDETLTNEDHVSKVVSITSNENCRGRTCVQSRRAKPDVPPLLCRRDKPRIIMISRITSVASEAGSISLPASAVLGMAQVLCAGDQKARYCY
jgi:hypothetical protein